MGGNASCAAFGGSAVHWIIQSSTAVLKYSVVPRHAISSGVAVSVDDAYRGSGMRNNILYYNILQYIVNNILYWLV